ncbi:hypothetical protein OE88DRAFT_666645 [Heliocybe sulcata]|uniref:Uncharacterized protein n=1 Tax=Heliocybe sulcata TaxID=5364 RepID=A0A5C3NDR8_9AGAM|nr:hypothetical protein OE88DRAFT_666645 [Heliocybe sulcata]
MASLPAKPAAPAGPTVSARGGDSGSWRSSGEPGSTFRGNGPRGRGSSRGSGRGGGGGGRGRNGRGGSKTPGATKNNETEPKAGIVAEKASSDIKPPPIERSTSNSTAASTTTQSSVNSDRTQRPKLNTRRASQQTARKVPTLSIDPSTPTAETPTGPSSASATRPNNRRRRSTHQTPKAVNPPSTVQTLTVDPRPMAGRSRKSLTGPPTPEPSSRDVPPHLSAGAETTSFDASVHNLVEQMRASVISHRPTTPGSHIDWAGDDDDSLPDLDDWGYTTKTDPGTVTLERTSIISPILEGQLKPLPDFSEISKPASPAHVSAPAPAGAAAAGSAEKAETEQHPSKAAPAKTDDGKSRRGAHMSGAGATRPAQSNGKGTARSQSNTARTFVNPLAHLVEPTLHKAAANATASLKGRSSIPAKPTPAAANPSPKAAAEQPLPVEEKPLNEDKPEIAVKLHPESQVTVSSFSKDVSFRVLSGPRYIGACHRTSASNYASR